MRWFFSVLFLFCGTAMAVAEPRFTVLVSDPPFEVRRYAPFTLVQAQIQGNFDAASRSGFRRIASCIFADDLLP
jgi:SOUL heme-binding protein